MNRLRPSLNGSSRQSGSPRSFAAADGGFALSDMRTIAVSFQTKLQANSVSANVLISIVNGPKVDEVVFQSGAEELRKTILVLSGLKYPQSFPDATPVRVIRKAILSRSVYSKNCTLVLMLPTDSAVPVPFQVAPPPTN
jgi:hypothetical protein